MTVKKEEHGRAQVRIILSGFGATRKEILLMYLEIVCAVTIPINTKHVQGPYLTCKQLMECINAVLHETSGIFYCSLKTCIIYAIDMCNKLF